LQMRL